jgi:hypothetical protein
MTTCNTPKLLLQEELKKGMAKSLSSDNIRLPNDLIQPIKKLNEVFRSGHQEEVLTGLSVLIAALDRGETIATYNSIDGKLGAIVQKLDQLAQLPPTTVTVGSVPQPSAVAAATVPKSPAPIAMIWLDHDTFAAHSFDIPGGQKRFRMGVWEEIPESWLPKIRQQVQLSAKWGMPGFRLEVSG